MSRAPIDAVLDTVERQATGAQPDGSDLPHATHSGVLTLFGKTLRCYRLSDGRAVFDADDFRDFFEGLI
jgi:hypothetical protein